MNNTLPNLCAQGTRYFENGNRLTQDACALLTRDRENASIADYQTTQFFELDGCESLDKLASNTLCHANLRYKTGYGMAPSCKIDADSSARLVNIREAGKNQLLARNFQAVPNLGRGLPAPNTEAFLINGMDTTALRQCDRIMEHEFDMRTPYVPEVNVCVNNALDVLSSFDNRIGQDSRQVFRQFMKTCQKNERA